MVKDVGMAKVKWVGRVVERFFERWRKKRTPVKLCYLGELLYIYGCFCLKMKHG